MAQRLNVQYGVRITSWFAAAFLNSLQAMLRFLAIPNAVCFEYREGIGQHTARLIVSQRR